MLQSRTAHIHIPICQALTSAEQYQAVKTLRLIWQAFKVDVVQGSAGFLHLYHGGKIQRGLHSSFLLSEANAEIMTE